MLVYRQHGDEEQQFAVMTRLISHLLPECVHDYQRITGFQPECPTDCVQIGLHHLLSLIRGRVRHVKAYLLGICLLGAGEPSQEKEL